MEYKITLLIPKTAHNYQPDPNAEVNGIKECMKQAAIAEFGANPPKGLRFPLKDGDVMGEGDDEPPYPGYWYITPKTAAFWPDGEPKNLLVIDGRRVPIGAGFVGGDWCKAKVNFKAYNNQANKGVAAYLSAVQWLYKDEPLGSSGSETAADEFDEVEGAHAGTATPAPSPEYDPFESE